MADNWTLAMVARDVVAGQIWLFGSALGLLVRLSPERQRGGMLLGLVGFVTLLCVFGG
ncbi:MAG: hypothetical protein JXA33_10910 [Anaerolineae bacterium]|nr:hypothetical protein [Anaerolineae bacterium]